MLPEIRGPYIFEIQDKPFTTVPFSQHFSAPEKEWIFFPLETLADLESGNQLLLAATEV